MSVRSNSIVTLDTRIQGGEIAHSTAILKCFCNAVTIQSFFFKFFYNDVHGSLYVQLYCYKNSKFGRWLITLYRL